ncbi:SsrA-binding protein [compost metagenome]
MDKTIINNRKAGFDYFLREKIEAGLVLEGWEVKSLREGKVNIQESYVMNIGGNITLVGCHISPMTQASSHTQCDPVRNKRLLLNKREIDHLIGSVERKGFTCVPVSLYFKGGKVKLEIALAEGKKQHDKRATEKTKEMKREADRAIKGR